MKNKKNKIILAIVLVVVVGLIWFGGQDGRELNPGINTGGHGVQNTNSQSEQTLGEKEEVEESASDEEFIDFTLDSLEGGSITLSDYRGEKPVVLDFFATWCHNCRRDMPNLSKMYEKYSDQVEVIGVNLQEKESKIQKYIDSAEILFPIVLDPRKDASRKFGVTYTNYHVLIGIDGDIAGIVPGDISESQILALIESSTQ